MIHILKTDIILTWSRFWFVTSCSLVAGCQCFGTNWCLKLTSVFWLADEGRWFS